MTAFILTFRGDTHSIIITEATASKAAETVAKAYGLTERTPRKENGLMHRAWDDRKGMLALNMDEHMILQ
jgi:hypothetical protein